MGKDMKPKVQFLAGVNGAGKSTLYDENLEKRDPFINPDIIARQIAPNDFNNPKVSIQAGRMALEQIQDSLENRRGFIYETTLSSHQALKTLQQAKDNDYQIILHYVGLNNRHLSVSRVARRVASGGHDIPREALMRRYDKSMDNLPKAMLLSDAIFIYDNSMAQRELVCRIINHKMAYQHPSMPEWADTAVKKFQTILTLRQQALDPQTPMTSAEQADWETVIFKADRQGALAYHARFVSPIEKVQSQPEKVNPSILPSREQVEKHFGLSQKDRSNSSQGLTDPNNKNHRPG